MKDQFLHNYRQPPSQEMADGLYQRLSRLPLDQAVQPEAISPPVTRSDAGWPRWVMQVASVAFVMILTLGLVMGVSPTARARIEEVMRDVGGLWVKETGLFSESETPVVPQTLTLAEAHEKIDFELRLPTWLPPGWTLQEDIVRFRDFSSPHLQLIWTDTAQKPRLNLFVQRSLPNRRQVVGPGSVEIVTINGEPATLVRGTWDLASQSWKASEDHINLRWQKENVSYQLVFLGDDLTVETLIRMAESIP